MGDVFELGEQGEGTTVSVRFHTPKSGAPSGVVAEAELLFTGGLLHGLKLAGVTVWRRRDGNGFNATMPARSYMVGGEKRMFIMLRPQDRDGDGLILKLSEEIVKAYAQWAK